MRVAVVGSRNITDKEYIFSQIDSFINEFVGNESVVIVSGGAEGVDSISKIYAKERGYDHIMFLPYFKVDNSAEFSPRHFFTRNIQIINNCDKLLALWDGESKGTAHAITYAEKKNKKVAVITPNKEVDIYV